MSKTIASDRFQGACLQMEDGAGSEYMYCYDKMTPEGRKRMQLSPFNLCPACIDEKAYVKMRRSHYNQRDAEIAAIEEIEKIIKEQED